MRFSRALGLTVGPRDDWFDPDLKVDTRLFLDPFLLLRGGAAWAKAHDELVGHFQHCYRLVAKATGRTSLSARQASTLLTFPEPSSSASGSVPLRRTDPVAARPRLA